MALKGNGEDGALRDAAARVARLRARESVLHTVAEMLNWANEWGKSEATHINPAS